MKYIVDRKLKFKTVPDRWEIQTICDTEKEAWKYADMFSDLICDASVAKGGGQVVAYRVRPETAGMNKHEEILTLLLLDLAKDKQLVPLLAQKKSFADAVLQMQHLFI
jgi:hypothetical protein